MQATGPTPVRLSHNVTHGQPLAPLIRYLNVGYLTNMWHLLLKFLAGSLRHNTISSLRPPINGLGWLPTRSTLVYRSCRYQFSRKPIFHAPVSHIYPRLTHQHSLTN